MSGLFWFTAGIVATISMFALVLGLFSVDAWAWWRRRRELAFRWRMSDALTHGRQVSDADWRRWIDS